MVIDRMDRVSEQVKREIAVILQQDIDDPKVRNVTIVRVEIARDLRSAKVFCEFFVDDDEKKDVMRGLKRANKHIRGELAKRVQMKYSPKLTFIEDTAENKKRSIEEIFDKLHEDEDRENSKNKEGYVMDYENLDRVIEEFKERDNFVVTAHINPEGDSIGSELAVYHLLTKLGKTAVVANHDAVPDNLEFLPGTKSIVNKIPDDFQADTIVILDCPLVERTGRVCNSLSEDQYVINIDHHVSNEYFGDVNWVEPKASSVGEMIFYLAQRMEVEVDPNIAKAVYTAIITDTGMFNYDNTSLQTHIAAGELIEAGLMPKEMHHEIFEKKTLSEIKLLGKALTTLQIEASGALAYMCLTGAMYKEEGVSYVSTDEFINFPRSIKGVEITLFFKENPIDPNKVNISFRSTGDVDVNKIASHFGGGGHERASGCLLECNLEEAKEKVLAEVKRVLKELKKK